MFYYASMAFTSEVARVALLVSTVLVSDATIVRTPFPSFRAHDGSLTLGGRYTACI